MVWPPREGTAFAVRVAGPCTGPGNLDSSRENAMTNDSERDDGKRGVEQNQSQRQGPAANQQDQSQSPARGRSMQKPARKHPAEDDFSSTADLPEEIDKLPAAAQDDPQTQEQARNRERKEGNLLDRAVTPPVQSPQDDLA
jgi:hypothetical protein